MKTILTVIIAAVLINLTCWLVLEAWDKEETIRMQRQQEYFKMLDKSHGEGGAECTTTTKN